MIAKTRDDLRHARSAFRQIEHLPRIEQPVELVQKLGALVPAALRVDKNEYRLGLLRWDGLDDEDLASGRGRRRWTGHGFDAAAVRRRSTAVDARSAAAASAAVSLLHRRFPTTSNWRFKRTLQVRICQWRLLIRLTLINILFSSRRNVVTPEAITTCRLVQIKATVNVNIWARLKDCRQETIANCSAWWIPDSRSCRMHVKFRCNNLKRRQTEIKKLTKVSACLLYKRTK